MAPLHERFHLQFVDNRTTPSFQQRINKFLEIIYGVNGKNVPLICAESDSKPVDGKSVVLARFDLNSHGHNLFGHINLAAQELCEMIFSPLSRQYLLVVTRDLILGVSAVDPCWKILFNRAFFSQALNEGENFVKEVGNKVKEQYVVPTWPLVFLGCLGFGLSFRMFLCPDVSQEEAIAELHSVETGSFLREILNVLAVKRTNRPDDEIFRDWNTGRAEFDSCTSELVLALQAYAKSHRATPVQQNNDIPADGSQLIASDSSNSLVERLPRGPASELSPNGRVAQAYYGFVEVLVKFAVSNQDFIKAMNDSRDASKSHMAAGAAGIGVAGVAALGCTGATENILFLGPVTFGNPTIVGGAAVAAIASGFIVYRKNKRRKAINGMIESCDEIHRWLEEADREAWLAHTMLSWIYCTGGADYQEYDFVNSASRDKWIQFLEANKDAVQYGRDAAGVAKVLETQATSLEANQVSVREAFAKIMLVMKSTTQSDGIWKRLKSNTEK